MASRPNNIDVPLIVWGNAYVAPFLQLTLPSLLAQGNIPALARQFRLRFKIFTATEHMALLQRHVSIDRLRRNGTVVLLDIGPIQKIRQLNQHAFQTCLFSTAITDAEENQAGLLFLAPDVIASDKSLSNIGQMTESGARAVMLPCVRAKKFPLLTEITELFALGATAPEELSIEGQALGALTLRHLHPMTACHIVRRNPNNSFICKAPLFYFPAGDTGLLIRSFVHSPVLIFPRKWPNALDRTIDLMDLPSACGLTQDEVVPVTDSEHALIVEFSDLSALTASPASLEEVTDWLGRLGLPFHLERLKFTYRLHSRAMEESDWEGAQNESDKLAIDILDDALKLMQTGLALNLTHRNVNDAADDAVRSAK